MTPFHLKEFECPQKRIESTLQKLRDYANSKNISVSNVLDHINEIDTLSDRVIKQLALFSNLIIELKHLQQKALSSQ